MARRFAVASALYACASLAMVGAQATMRTDPAPVVRAETGDDAKPSTIEHEHHSVEHASSPSPSPSPSSDDDYHTVAASPSPSTSPSPSPLDDGNHPVDHRIVERDHSQTSSTSSSSKAKSNSHNESTIRRDKEAAAASSYAEAGLAKKGSSLLSRSRDESDDANPVHTAAATVAHASPPTHAHQSPSPEAEAHQKSSPSEASTVSHSDTESKSNSESNSDTERLEAEAKTEDEKGSSSKESSEDKEPEAKPSSADSSSSDSDERKDYAHHLPPLHPLPHARQQHGAQMALEVDAHGDFIPLEKEHQLDPEEENERERNNLGFIQVEEANTQRYSGSGKDNNVIRRQ